MREATWKTSPRSISMVEALVKRTSGHRAVGARKGALLFRLLSTIAAIGCTHPSNPAPPVRPPAAPTRETRPTNRIPDSTREYSGEWDSGLESSYFRDCNGTLPGKVWVSLAPSAAVGTEWSDSTGAAKTRRYYVRVRGILRGPVNRRQGGGYGERGSADYELYVTRVLEVKRPGQPNCVVRR